MPGSCLLTSALHSTLTQVDHRLPVWQEAARDVGETCLWIPHHQHWSSPSLRSYSPALFPLHQQLHPQSPVRQAPEVCGRHHAHWAHLGMSMPTCGRWPSSDLVQPEQPGALHFKDSGDGRRLQEEHSSHWTHTGESILTSSITVWYAAATAKDKSRLQLIMCSAEKVIGCNVPSLLSPLWQEAAVHQDQNHPRHEQFLPFCSWDP